MAENKVMRNLYVTLLLTVILIIGYIFRAPIGTKLDNINEFVVYNGGPNLKESLIRVFGALAVKDKVDVKTNNLLKLPLMKEHQALVDFLHTALMVCRAKIQKRGTGAAGGRPTQIITGNASATFETGGTGSAGAGNVAGGAGRFTVTPGPGNLTGGPGNASSGAIKYATSPGVPTSGSGAGGAGAAKHVTTAGVSGGGGGAAGGGGMGGSGAKPETKSVSAIPTDEDVISNTIEEPEWACDQTHSPNYIIYCQGDLLHVVMMLNLFKDSKTFVDKPLKRDPDEVNSDFKKRFPHGITVNDREAVRQFITENFEEEGHELEECELVDWQEEPEQLLSIADPQLRQFALNVNQIWKSLCRTIKKEIMEHPQRHSLLYVPHEFVVPGGRFREFYYWDTYWVIKGLLASGMKETSRRMILNFEYLLKTIGFIPNGGRVYYLKRSQPPLFIPMVYEYYMATEDDEFLQSMMDAMEMEFDFWKKKRMVNITIDGRNYSVFFYRADSNVPRPESYREDYQTAERVDRHRKRKLWRDIASAAESGWDFSSRWFQNRKSMDTIVTTDIAPVDLNAFMYWNMKILAHLQGEIGNLTRRDELNRERARFVDTFEAVFFDPREGSWFDVNIKTGEHYDDAYPSLAIPLFTECYHVLKGAMMVDVMETLQRKGLLQFPGGIPASLMKGTNQQWDYPNGWAPINHMIIEGLRKSNNPTMQQRAFEIANKWINRNYALYQKDHKMWEKYDVAKEYVRAAKGGEYENQFGFGWTNGVVLDLLVTFSQRAIVKPTGLAATSADTHAVSTGRPEISSNKTITTQYPGTGRKSDMLWRFIRRIFIRGLAAFLKCKSASSSNSNGGNI